MAAILDLGENEESGGYFGLAFAMPPPPLKVLGLPCVERFLALMFSEENCSARFTKFAGYLHWGVSFSGTEINLILKNKIAAMDISLKIIYIFRLAVSHR